jgi:hypothetical protein
VVSQGEDSYPADDTITPVKSKDAASVVAHGPVRLSFCVGARLPFCLY